MVFSMINQFNKAQTSTDDGPPSSSSSASVTKGDGGFSSFWEVFVGTAVDVALVEGGGPSSINIFTSKANVPKITRNCKYSKYNKEKNGLS